MSDIPQRRARRFAALHDLLTGAACTPPMAPRPKSSQPISDHLMRDIGLPENDCPSPAANIGGQVSTGLPWI